MNSTVDLVLRDGTHVGLSREALLDAAKSMPESDGSMVEAVIEGRRLAAVPLISRALMVPGDLIGRRWAEQALAALGVTIDDGTQPIAERQLRHGAELPMEEARETVTDLTPEIAASLQRLVNQWVAVRRGEILGHASTLRQLRREIGDSEATVLRISAEQPELGS